MNGTEFVGLYDIQYPRIFRYLLWRLRQRDAAEELAAEVFAIALRTFQQGPAPAQAGGWLVDVADHLASRTLRRQQVEELLDSAGLAAERAPEELPDRAGPAAERDPEELAIGRLEHETVRACVDALNPEQRKVLLLRIVAGLSASEAAEILGTTDVMVRSLQLRALRTLRTIWKEAEANAGRGGTGAQ